MACFCPIFTLIMFITCIFPIFSLIFALYFPCESLLFSFNCIIRACALRACVCITYIDIYIYIPYTSISYISIPYTSISYISIPYTSISYISIPYIFIAYIFSFSYLSVFRNV